MRWQSVFEKNRKTQPKTRRKIFAHSINFAHSGKPNVSQDVTKAFGEILWKVRISDPVVPVIFQGRIA